MEMLILTFGLFKIWKRGKHQYCRVMSNFLLAAIAFIILMFYYLLIKYHKMF